MFEGKGDKGLKIFIFIGIGIIMKTRKTGIILAYINTVLNMVCGLFLSSYLLRMTGDTDYGIYQTVSSFVNYLVLLEFGTGSVMTRNLSVCLAKNAPKEEIQKNVSTIWSITNALSMLILVVSIAFYLSFSGIYKNTLTTEQIVYGKRIFVFVTIHLIASFLTSTLNGVAMGFEEYTIHARVWLVRIVSRTILLTALIACYRHSIIIAMVDAGIGICMALFLFIHCKKKHKLKFPLLKFDKVVLKTALPLCLAIFFQSVVNQANTTVAKFITGIKLGPELVALYSVAIYVYNLYNSLATIPIAMYAPQIVQDVTNHAEGKPLLDKIIQPCRIIVLISGTLLFAFIAVGKQFVSILYGANKVLIWPIAIILMTPKFMNMTTEILVNVLDALNKRMAHSIITCATTILNVVAIIFLVDAWGVVGTAISTGVFIFLGQVLLMNIYYARKLKLDVWYVFRKAYQGILIYQMLACALSFTVAYFIPNVYLAFLAGTVTFVAVLGVGYLFFGANEEEKKMIDKILVRFKIKKEKKGEDNNDTAGKSL